MKKGFTLYCLLFLMASCKYDDGPLFSLVSPEKRIEGYYKIDCVQENGIDQMARIDTLNITYFLFSGSVDIIGPYYNDFQVRIADTVNYYSFWFFSGNNDDH